MKVQTLKLKSNEKHEAHFTSNTLFFPGYNKTTKIEANTASMLTNTTSENSIKNGMINNRIIGSKTKIPFRTALFSFS